MKNLTKRLLCGALSAAMLMPAAWAASIQSSVSAVSLPKGTNTVTFDLSLTADAPFAGAEFGLKPSADDVTFQSLTFLDVLGESTVQTQKDGVLYFGFFAGTNQYQAKTYQVARLTYSYTGTASRTISLDSSKIVTIDEEANKTVGDTSTEPFTVTITRQGTSTAGGGGGGGSTGGTTTTTKPEITVGEGGKASLSNDNKTVTITPNAGYEIADVTVNGASRGAVSTVTVSSGDKVVISFKKQDTAANNPFTDLEGHWAKDTVLNAVGQGLFSGTSATTFGPNMPVTRGMLVTVLHRMESKPTGGTNPFTDVAAGQYYTDAVAWAASQNVVAGMSATTFAPNASITREQMAAILYRYAQNKGQDTSKRADLSSFVDADSVSAYAKEAMSWANAAGLISGRSTIELAPKGTATRAEAAAILMRFLGK